MGSSKNINTREGESSQTGDAGFISENGPFPWHEPCESSSSLSGIGWVRWTEPRACVDSDAGGPPGFEKLLLILEKRVAPELIRQLTEQHGEDCDDGHI